MKLCTMLIATAAIFCGGFAYGQEERPTTKEHLKVLQPFVGEWSAETTNDEGETVDIVLKYAWLFDNTAMSFEWGVKNATGEYNPVYKGLIGWNAETESVVMRGVFVRGAVSTTAIRQNGKKWTYNRDSVTVEGSHVLTEQSMEFLDDDTLKYQRLKRDGESVTDDPIIYKRTKK